MFETRAAWRELCDSYEGLCQRALYHIGVARK